MDETCRPLLDPAEYTRLLNNQIGNLRNPKPSTSKNVRLQGSTHDDEHDDENDYKDNDDDDEDDD